MFHAAGFHAPMDGLEVEAAVDGPALATEPGWLTDRQADLHMFKEALARLAGGVAVVTGWEDGLPHGVLVSSITGLSLTPPRFLFCVRKEASSHAAFLRADHCGVTVLGDQNEAEAQTFIQPELRARRFKGDAWRLDAPIPPLLATGLSSTLCAITGRLDAGTHTIFIVTAQRVRVNEGEPLVSFNRELRGLAAKAGHEPSQRMGDRQASEA